MEEEDDTLAHSNIVKVLINQLNGADVAISNEDLVMTLLKSLSPTYEYLIIAMQTRPDQELTLHSVTSRFLHELSRQKKNESMVITLPFWRSNRRAEAMEVLATR